MRPRREARRRLRLRGPVRSLNATSCLNRPAGPRSTESAELEGVRAWPQEPRRRHDLAERGCNCRVGTTEERSSRRPAVVLEPRGPDRVDAAGRLQPAAPPDRGVPGLAAPLDGPQPQGPGPHHTLAPGAAPDPSPRRPDSGVTSSTGWPSSVGHRRTLLVGDGPVSRVRCGPVPIHAPTPHWASAAARLSLKVSREQRGRRRLK